MIVDMKNGQILNNISCHSDREVFYKLYQIIWKEKKNIRYRKYNGMNPYFAGDTEGSL